MKGKSLKLSINLYSEDVNQLSFLSLLGRIHRLREMLEKRKEIIHEWDNEIKKILKKDIESIDEELKIRLHQFREIEYHRKNKKEVYKVRVDVITQKNGSKFYRGRINIPKIDRINFNLKTPRKEFLIRRTEIKTLVGRMNHLKLDIPKSIINQPRITINGKNIIHTTLGSELQYLVYEKYINYLKSKVNQNY